MEKIKQQPILDMFKNAVKKDRLSHLYLFTGPKGSGKKELAFSIAAYLFGGNYTEERLKREGHINLMFIEPAGQNIKKEQIAALQNEFSKTSLQSGKRIYIIDEVDKLSTAAANGLLKFLEEPLSKDTIGFLLSDNPNVVLPTIQSRSQIIYLKPRSEKDLTNELIELGIDPYLATCLPFINKDKAVVLTMSEDPQIHYLVDLFKSYHQTLLDQASLWFLMESKMQPLKENKVLLTYFLELIMVYYLDLLKSKTHEIISFNMFKDDYEVLTENMSLEKILSSLKEIQEILFRLNYNINIEMALIQLVISLES
ncbi:MAG: AAA family ATPase [Acholeplasma sp.]|jgi:DNA polymerase-3 subunit delta'|nr:AAA family ATPase [Acholeplasma sp.]